MDKDGDGKISTRESPRPLLVRRFDKDGDGSLSMDEFRAVMEMIVEDSGGSSESEPWKPAKFESAIPTDAPISEKSVLAAAEYNAKQKGISFYVMYDGQLIYADYPNGGSADREHELASGTKSFTGVMAMAAIEDGLIESLDERVCETITEWKDDPQRSKITVRHLLDLTSGLETDGDDPGQVPSYRAAIQSKCVTEPGSKFRYGPVHFQCFGELVRRKLKADGRPESPLAYMEERIFEPIGLKHGRWRLDSDGQPNLPSGARLTAEQWAKFGELVRLGGTVDGKQVLPEAAIKTCLVGSNANPAYGLTFWLNEPVSAPQRRGIPQLRFATDDLTGKAAIPSDMVFAAGAGKQRLYVSSDAKLVIVRQASGIVDALDRQPTRAGQRAGFSDVDFLSRLLEDR